MAASQVVITNLIAVSVINGVSLTVVYELPNGSCLSYMRPAEFELFESMTNNFSNAVSVAKSTLPSFNRVGFTTAAPRYYWVQATDGGGGVVARYPVSNTAGVVGTPKLVTAAELGPGSVTEVALGNGVVTREKIGNGAVNAEQLAALAVNSAAIAANAITVAKIVDGAISESKLGTGSVSAAKIAAGAVVAGKIAAGAVTAGTIAAAAITATNIAAGAVTADAILAGAITAVKIGADAVTAEKIAAGSITADKIGARQITAGKIAAGAVSAFELTAESIVAGKIAAGALNVSSLMVDGVVITPKIAAQNVTTALVTSPSGERRFSTSDWAYASANFGTGIANSIVLIDANIYVGFYGPDGSAFGNVLLQIKKGSTVIEERTIFVDDSSSGLEHFMGVDLSPGTGNNFYTFNVRALVGGATLQHFGSQATLRFMAGKR